MGKNGMNTQKNCLNWTLEITCQYKMTRGVIVSFEGHDKYRIRIDGSRQLTFRNCKHLKKFIPLFRELDISYKLNDYDYDKPDMEDPATNQNW